VRIRLPSALTGVPITERRMSRSTVELRNEREQKINIVFIRVPCRRDLTWQVSGSLKQPPRKKALDLLKVQ
jgi:hypothetical protein